jgi:flagellin FlaB
MAGILEITKLSGLQLNMKSNIFSTCAKAVANVYRGQRGMTGLETAIILIAFVTVAALFGYAVLSAGLFSAERGKETVYSSLQQAKANMEIAGSVIVKSSDITDNATFIIFTVRNAINGAPIDMTPNFAPTLGQNKCVISLTTTGGYFSNIKWDIARMGAADSDGLLEAGEQFGITIDLADLGFDDPGIGVNEWFNIQVKPTQGSTMTIQRTLPAGLEKVMDLY